MASLDAETGLRLAVATRATLLSESHLMLCRLKEHEILLADIHHTLHEVQTQVDDADLQLGTFRDLFGDSTHYACLQDECDSSFPPSLPFEDPVPDDSGIEITFDDSDE